MEGENRHLVKSNVGFYLIENQGSKQRKKVGIIEHPQFVTDVFQNIYVVMKGSSADY